MLSRSPLFGGKNRVTFSLPAREPAGEVSVVGDFNAWEPGRHSLVPRRNGTRSVSIVLRRLNGSSATLPLTVQDRCGTWKTFLGGGAGAW